MNQQQLTEFAQWGQATLSGDEKGQAQLFLDRFFQAFGHPGCLEVGGLSALGTAFLLCLQASPPATRLPFDSSPPTVSTPHRGNAHEI